MPPTENQSDNNSEVLTGTPPTTDTTPNNDLTDVIRGALSESDRRAREAEQRARDLEDRLSAMQRTTVTTQNNDNITDDDFWKAPAANLNTLLNNQIAPLRQELEENKRRNAYEDLKKQYRGYEGFSQIESLIDLDMKDKEPTHANIQRAIRYVLGDLVLSGKVNPQQVPVPQNNNQNNNNAPVPVNTNQAHLRPSRAAVPSNNEVPKRRQLNEFEKRLAREARQTDDEYLDALESGPQVKTWKKEGAK